MKESSNQVGRGYPESKPVETATSVTDDPSGNESEGSSPAGGGHILVVAS
jgi:hypothetical protein